MPEISWKYIQWNEILRDALNGKLIIVQNKKTETDTESEEGSIEVEESDFDNHGTSERDGYRPIRTLPKDELNLHTDVELLTGENKEIIARTENQKTRRSNSRFLTGYILSFSVSTNAKTFPLIPYEYEHCRIKSSAAVTSSFCDSK